MKAVTVTGLQLQFDTTEEVTKAMVIHYIQNVLNTTLSDIHKNDQPQLFISGKTKIIEMDFS